MPEITMPAIEGNSGWIPTLNCMGWTSNVLDPYSQAFVDFAPHAPGPVLDIGAAYGVATVPALRNGAVVIANDTDKRHLELLVKHCPGRYRDRLKLVVGAVPDRVEFEDESLGAILACRVLHFLDGPTAEHTAKQMFQWLATGGKVFVVAATPYLRDLTGFALEYERRKQRGFAWPGLIEDITEYPFARAGGIPQQLHLMDIDVLHRIFERAGFEIERTGYISREDFPEDVRLDGRENVGLIATKPPQA